MPDMTALAPFEADVDPRRIPVDVEIVVPVYNEAPQLAERITALRSFLDESFPFRALVTIVDNASTDETSDVAARLADTVPGVAAMHLQRKGRGYALRSAWSTSEAPVVAYMDVDLSTSLAALLPLVAPLLSGHRDVAIGTRLARGAHVVRGPKRELISRSYNLLLKLILRGRFSDAQCGFKALRRDAAEQLLPLVEDNEWFFDTELLVTAERLGLRISEVPVDWVDDPDSRVNIVTHGHRRPARRVADAGAAAPRSCGASARNEVTADQLLRFAGVGVHQHARLSLPVHRLAPVARCLRRQRRGHGHRHGVQHGRAPRAVPGHGWPGPPRPTGGGGGRPLPGQPRPHHAGTRWSPSGWPRRRWSPSSLPSPWPTWPPPSSVSPCCGPGSSALTPTPAPTPHGGLRLTDVTPAPDAPVGVLDLPVALPDVAGADVSSRAGAARFRLRLAARAATRSRGAVPPRQGERRAVGAAGSAHPPRQYRRALPVGPRRQRLGQLLLLCRRAGRHQELEGHVLRLLRLVQLHHGGQAAGLPVADGDLGAHLRAQLVEHARAAGSGGRGHGGAGLPGGAALVQRAGRAARRRRGRAHARGAP